jgi:hypothetical protein
MLVKRVSRLTGKVRELDLITQEQINAWERGGSLIQNAFPNLSKAEREFLITGSVQEEWDAVFGTC